MEILSTAPKPSGDNGGQTIDNKLDGNNHEDKTHNPLHDPETGSPKLGGEFIRK